MRICVCQCAFGEKHKNCIKAIVNICRQLSRIYLSVEPLKLHTQINNLCTHITYCDRMQIKRAVALTSYLQTLGAEAKHIAFSVELKWIQSKG